MSAEYLHLKKVKDLPLIPLKGSIDLTYRCNDNCRHCWVRIPANAKEKDGELSFKEIKRIVDEAKKMGCRKWSISGGEPMLRPDFPEIFDYITSNSATYSLNTNGTLITTKIAKLMKRKGTKMVAIYGATAQVHDYITRKPGSFAQTMTGFAYLKESGVGFIVQIIPMRDNYHQFKEMIRLAEALSPHYRIGAAWLHFSYRGEIGRNQEILRQRLEPKNTIEVDPPDVSFDEWMEKNESYGCNQPQNDGYLFPSCITNGQRFHIDPYGRMSFCCYIDHPALRYSLRKGSFRKYWEEFIPSLKDKFKVDKEYVENCGSCELRKECEWCPAFGYLEHQRFSAKVDYFCAMTREYIKFKNNWRKKHRRYYRVADITIQVDSDLPVKDNTFSPKLKLFEVNKPNDDTLTILHRFSLPKLYLQDLGEKIYCKVPWAIYKKKDTWIYLGIHSFKKEKQFYSMAVFNHNYTRVRIYHKDERVFRIGNLGSLSIFSDQILLAQVLADREGCFLHSSGVILDGKGLLFAGHSEAGKSSIVKMLKGKAEILCDDRIIVRRKDEGFRIYGTWSHGEVEDVSANNAPLKAILFLEKSDKNYLEPLKDKKEIIKRLLAYVIKPLVTTEWWDKTLSLVERIATEVPCYKLYFDLSGKIVKLLENDTRIYF